MPATSVPRFPLVFGREGKNQPTNRRCADCRIAARSIFSRVFIKVSKVLSTRAFSSSDIGNPLVATCTKASPRPDILVMNSI